MRIKLRYLFLLFLGLLAISGAWWMGYKFQWAQVHSEQNVSVVLEQVKRVTKLVTTEGYISEIYDHSDYKMYDISPLRKKALVRVDGKVSVGYDFDKITISTDEDRRVITIDSFPPAEILSIDHDLDYYDITQGTFNRFTTADYNKINAAAKEFISQKALESDLMEKARGHRQEFIEMLSAVISGMGWQLEVNETPNWTPGRYKG